MGCFPLHLGDVAIIGLDLSQYHKLGRPKALPLDLNKFRDPLWMLPDTTPYSTLKPLPDPQETHPQQARGELVDFTDGLGSSGVSFSPSLSFKNKTSFSLPQTEQFSDHQQCSCCLSFLSCFLPSIRFHFLRDASSDYLFYKMSW